MKIIWQKNIDTKKWDALVATNNGTYYSQTHFLNALAENWCVIIEGDYTAGIAIPYSVRLGIKGIYTPNFIRYVEWIGEKCNKKELENLLHENFSRCQLHTKQELFSNSKQLKFQFLENSEQLKLGSQTKRSLKKFAKSNCSIAEGKIESVLPIVLQELQHKVKSLQKIDLQRFLKAYSTCNKNALKVFAILDEQKQVQGGMLFYENNDTWYYIKGGAKLGAMQNGTMYACMLHIIKNELSPQKKIDFVGSMVEGVQRFNKNFGAEDCSYFSYSFDNSPWWFRFLLQLKSKRN